LQLSVLYRDDDLFVVDKPAGIPTTSPDGKRCLVEHAVRMNRGAKVVHPTSRLDIGVTGVVVFARTDRAVTGILAARAAKRYLRRYLALASGALAETAGRWEWPIAIDPKDKTHRVALAAGEKGERLQEAASRFEVVAVTDRVTRIWLFPETGRTHQLRVHAARAGHALVGDVDYGGPKRVVLADGRVVTAKRPMLHCESVELAHPATGEPLRFVAPVPEDLEGVWSSITGAD
jgi:RluA family pseudouridine synthase